MQLRWWQFVFVSVFVLVFVLVFVSVCVSVFVFVFAFIFIFFVSSWWEASWSRCGRVLWWQFVKGFGFGGRRSLENKFITRVMACLTPSSLLPSESIVGKKDFIAFLDAVF